MRSGPLRIEDLKILCVAWSGYQTSLWSGYHVGPMSYNPLDDVWPFPFIGERSRGLIFGVWGHSS